MLALVQWLRLQTMVVCLAVPELSLVAIPKPPPKSQVASKSLGKKQSGGRHSLRLPELPVHSSILKYQL